MSGRDRKLLFFIVPAILAAAYWFVILSPVRSEGSKLGDHLAKQEQHRDQLKAEVARLGQARNDFATDYAAIVELGKAVPTSVDMPSLLVQLTKASHGTGIDFQKITASPRLAAAASSGAAAGGTPAVAAGGEKASTGAGKATEKANDTKASGDKAAGAAPAAPAAGATGTTSGVAGLDAVPLQFTFNGDFFNLADFFHRMKRFVHVVNDRVDVRGRLMTIESVDFKTKAFPSLEAQVTAKVYLTPKTEGATAGADPAGPGGSSAASTPGTSPAPSASPPAAVIGR